MALFAVVVIHMLMPTPAEAPSFPMVVTTRQIESGERLEADDVALRHNVDELPGAVPDPGDVIGEYLVGPLPEGAPVLSTHLLTSEFLENSPAGTVIAPVTIVDTGGNALLQPGVHVDLYAMPDEFTDSHDAVLLAPAVRVAGIATEKGTSNLLATTEDVHVFYLEIPDSAIDQVLGASARSPLYAVLSGPRS
ncbi:Flp pilus assembly protein CpaB [Trueperella bialowiezensis]|uniref:Flp pilus assembly protein CpaB n=1 Tax=Trueperella bialowiezensis TaxID=312285 RepID=A0A448PDS9_9ACTO|nr:Flp pilus assembly protein CpaB [Trueperella bialowiezensis]